MSDKRACPGSDGLGKKNAVCNTCTIRLVQLCYEKTWWFRIVREPLVMGMRVLGCVYGVDPEEYEVRSEECRNCIRFLKTGLKDKSGLFRWLNGLIDPIFNRIRDSIVSDQELQESRDLARARQEPDSEVSKGDNL